MLNGDEPAKQPAQPVAPGYSRNNRPPMRREDDSNVVVRIHEGGQEITRNA